MKNIFEIGKIKKEMDKALEHLSLENVCRMIVGTCKSMGIRVVSDRPKPEAKLIPMRRVGQK